MAEYDQTLFQASFRFPLRAAFALLPSRSERMGMPVNHAGTGDKASLNKRAEVKAWLAENYLIVPAKRLTAADV